MQDFDELAIDRLALFVLVAPGRTLRTISTPPSRKLMMQE
jgi:hypothetical protein